MKKPVRWIGWTSVGLIAGLLQACDGSDSAQGAEGGASGSEEVAKAYTELRSEAAYDTSPDVNDAEYATVISAINDIGLSLVRGDSSSGRGMVASPFSIAMGLGMVAAGADGTTLDELRQVLGKDVDATVMHRALNRMGLELLSDRVAPHEDVTAEMTLQVVIEKADAIWLGADTAVVPTYLDLLSSNYDAGAKLISFADESAGAAINQWIAEKTNGTISAILPSGSVSKDTQLVLTDALYVLASWASPFDRTESAVKSFTTAAGNDVDVTMAHRVGRYAYAQGDDWQMIDVPYDGGKLVFSVILPTLGSFTSVRESIDSGWVADASSLLEAQSVELSLPKFRIAPSSESLKASLEALGIVDAFNCPGANFGKMIASGDPVCVSALYHSAGIGVDESGTEASAATTADIVSIGLEPDGPVLPDVTMVVDHPFIFLVREQSGAIVFVGQVLNPAGG